jgi:hypothetical protein
MLQLINYFAAACKLSGADSVAGKESVQLFRRNCVRPYIGHYRIASRPSVSVRPYIRALSHCLPSIRGRIVCRPSVGALSVVHVGALSAVHVDALLQRDRDQPVMINYNIGIMDGGFEEEVLISIIYQLPKITFSFSKECSVKYAIKFGGW